MTKNQRSTGNRIYSIVGWFCYIACTIISAILNIYLLSRLDQSWAWFLLTMSLSLEFGKAYILIRANTYKSLAEYLKHCKLPLKKVSRKEHKFYGIYVLFALLSITASLCFSLTITDKTEQSYSLQKQEISQNIAMLQESKTKYDEALKKFTSLEDDYDNEVKSMKEDLRNAQDLFNDAGNKLDNKAKELCQAAGDDISNWTNYRRGNPDYDRYRDSLEYDKIKTKYNRASEDYNDAVNGKILERARRTKENAEKEYNEKVSLYGTLESLKLELSKVEKQELETAGSSKCFILLAQTFGVPDKVRTVKFIILLFVSLLVELCIWLSSPDLKIDSDLLYSFRNDLEFSNKKDVDKLLKEIKSTNTRFSIEEKDNNEETNKLLSENNKLKKDCKNLENENKELNEKYSEMDNLLNTMQETHVEEKKELEDKNINISEALNNEIKEKDEQIETLNNKVTELKNMMKNLHEKHKESVSKNIEISDKKYDDMVNEYEKQLEKLYADNTNTKNEYEKQIADLKASKDDNKKFTEDDVKSAIKKTKDKSAKKIQELTKAMSNLEEDYNKVFSENSNLQVANKSLERKLDEANSKKKVEESKEERIRSAESELLEMLDNK